MSTDRPPECPACRDSGWLRYTKDKMPWAGACYCAKGRWLNSERPASQQDQRKNPPTPVRVAHAPRDVYRDKLDEADEVDHPNSTPERKAAALRYILASFRRDPNPEIMVAGILAGERDDVVRTVRDKPRRVTKPAGVAETDDGVVF